MDADSSLQVFEKLKEQVPQKEQDKRDQELNARLLAQHQRAQSRLGELVWPLRFQGMTVG
jgi:hypothetical protein